MQQYIQTYEFQFPTGWNSTTSLLCRGIVREMFQFPTGWNSTDLILSASASLPRVSIPNGMEFYNFIIPFSIPFRWSFNSQRDGILRYHQGKKKYRKPKVSIPNGMEFYKRYSKHSYRLAGFQFPTGWNSTAWERSETRATWRFNSQRDGILPNRKIRIVDFAVFQFPTGWNSTIAELRGLGVFVGGFNSQRDGILQCGWNSPVSALRGFNSQRDGILLFFDIVALIFCQSFNSQRDGILPIEAFFKFGSISRFNSQRDGILR